ncbi:hypothetical protein COL940_014265 [Colletotrichum noveboracense]|nr:hypothetical protein COL940_014265 [Colletotrichum noveboracense]
MSVSGPKIVPIFRVTREFYKGSVACSRTQFPPTVAFAVTVHKSQGLTLERAVMDISQREHIVGRQRARLYVFSPSKDLGTLFCFFLCDSDAAAAAAAVLDSNGGPVKKLN